MLNHLYEITRALDGVLDYGVFMDPRVLERDLRPELLRLAGRRPELATSCGLVAAAHGKASRGSLSVFDLRSACAKTLAWAIPTPAAVSMLGRLGTVVEVGAGTGYWSALASSAGATVHAFDDGSWSIPPTWYPVQVGSPEVVESIDAQTLLLCWPPYGDSMAFEALQRFRGDTLVYVGEGYGGCTADDAFHDLLSAEWDRREVLPSVSWPGIHDLVEVHDRIAPRPRATTVMMARERVRQLGLGRFSELDEAEEI